MTIFRFRERFANVAHRRDVFRRREIRELVDHLRRDGEILRQVRMFRRVVDGIVEDRAAHFEKLRRARCLRRLHEYVGRDAAAAVDKAARVGLVLLAILQRNFL